MKKSRLFLASIAMGLAAAVAAPAMANDAIVQANNQVRIYGSFGTSFDYSKTDADGLRSGEKDGTQTGLGLTLVQQTNLGTIKDVYVAANIGYAKGDTKYNGWALAPGATEWTPYSGKTDYKQLDFDLKLGKAFQILDDQAQVTPYVTVGTRKWNRDAKDFGGNRDVHSNAFYGIGALFQYAVSPSLVLSADAMFAKNRNSEIDWKNGGVTYSMADKGTTRFGLGANYRLTENLSLFGEYVITQTKFGASGVYQGYVEPSSTAKSQRLNVGVAVHF